MPTDLPADYASWSAEVRELYDAVLRAEAANDGAAGADALEHLFGLAGQREDLALRQAARHAFLELGLRYAPESLAARYFRDGGQAAVELAAEILSSSTTDETARRTAEKLLEVVAAKFPPKGRA